MLQLKLNRGECTVVTSYYLKSSDVSPNVCVSAFLKLVSLPCFKLLFPFGKVGYLHLESHFLMETLLTNFLLVKSICWRFYNRYKSHMLTKCFLAYSLVMRLINFVRHQQLYPYILFPLLSVSFCLSNLFYVFSSVSWEISELVAILHDKINMRSQELHA